MLYDYGDYWEIEITAPSDNGDYAKDVNYALEKPSVMAERQRVKRSITICGLNEQLNKQQKV